MRAIVIAVSVAACMASGSLVAQSLEESYAKLCTDAVKAKSETCQILAKSLVAKLQGQQANTESGAPVAEPDQATEAVWRRHWGVMYDMAGKEMFAVVSHAPNTTLELKLMSLNFRSRTEWKVPGEVLVSRFRGVDGTWAETATSRWDPATQQIVSTSPPPSNLVTRMVAHPDGTLEVLEATYAGTTSRSLTRRIADGRYQTLIETKKDGVWTPLVTAENVEYTPERLALEQQRLHAEQQRATQQLADQKQQERDAKRARSEQQGAMFNSVLQGVAQGVAESNSGSYAEAQANLDATVAGIQAAAAAGERQQARSVQPAAAPAVPPRVAVVQQPGYSAGAGASATPQAAIPESRLTPSASPTSGKQLRFVLMMSMRNLPGDKVNPTCYSNTVTREGPPGWGEPGFLPPGSGQQARNAVEALKPQFIAACQASGRQITSEGNFNWVWNQLQGDEQKLASARAKYAEDVTVSIQ